MRNKIKGIKLNENEEIIKMVRHHSSIVVPHLAICFLIVALDFFLMYYLFMQGWWGLILFFTVIVIVFLYIVRLVFLFKKNKLIITNQRLIDFEQASFLDKVITDFPYSKIKSIDATVKGVGPALWKYGNLKILLYDDVAPYEFFKIPQAKALEDEIKKRIEKQEKNIEQAEAADPLELVMAEVDLLSRRQKIKLIKQIKAQLRKEIEN